MLVHLCIPVISPFPLRRHSKVLDPPCCMSNERIRELYAQVTANLDGRLMAIQGVNWSGACPMLPDVDHVVVGAAGERIVVTTPPEATHFLGVVQKRPDMVVGHAHIMVMNVAAS